PKLSVSPASRWPRTVPKRLRRPKHVEQLVAGSLTGTKLVDPRALGLSEVTEIAFLEALASALEGVLLRGLDIARRLGWDGKRKIYRLGQLHRVSFVPPQERAVETHEPDEFHEGIAPCVKILHFVVQQLSMHKAVSARLISERWNQTPTPIHLR